MPNAHVMQCSVPTVSNGPHPTESRALCVVQVRKRDSQEEAAKPSVTRRVVDRQSWDKEEHEIVTFVAPASLPSQPIPPFAALSVQHLHLAARAAQFAASPSALTSPPPTPLQAQPAGLSSVSLPVAMALPRSAPAPSNLQRCPWTREEEAYILAQAAQQAGTGGNQSLAQCSASSVHQAERH